MSSIEAAFYIYLLVEVNDVSYVRQTHVRQKFGGQLLGEFGRSV